ncbi:hypothetical protein [Rhodopirellula sp. SWK7]|uniref:hypothetical protein n=1 Tax=Rhodopirellula sp. SWK7 TaxID=595460 RepID=UPI0002BD9E8C|nr:hypothetical protein [Rhodopirellula sp. SWK7]EMI41716.1 secreted protein [Rhodopirellula sp. SWK7]
MTSTRIFACSCALALLGVSTAIHAADIPEEDLGAFHRPTDEKSESFVAARAKGVLAEIAKVGTFQKWKTFEDERVRFSYPAHEAISVEVKRNEPIPVDGDRVSSVDVSFSRAYRLAVNGETFLVLMSRKAEWLDDGICFCGAVAYDRYLIRNGNLYRFSFLSDGVLKKMQVLGEGERIMMFEWTHLPIHPAVYRRIARSVELKTQGSWTEADCRKRVLDRYGPEGAVGWFDEGSSVEAVEEVLGRPTRTEAGGMHIWEYPKTEDGYRWTDGLSLPFADRKLDRFDSRYFRSGWDQQETIKGGVPWMIEVSEPYEDPPVRGAKAKRMPEQMKKELLALFLEKADNEGEHFDSLCQVMKTLVVQGVRDKRALDVVRKRFASEGGHHAAWVLHETGQAEDVTLFVDKIRELYRDAKDAPGRDFGLSDLFGSSDLHNWLAFIPNDDERYPKLLRDGLSSPNEDVRDSAYYFLDSAPFSGEERIVFVRAGLKDSSARVRYLATRYYAKEKMSKRDWDLLRNAAEQEKDKYTLKKMDEVLEKQQLDAAAALPNEDKAEP